MSSDSVGIAQKPVVAGPDKRRKERVDCFVRGTLTTSRGDVPCTILDINSGGVGILVGATFELCISEKVTVSSPQTGALAGVIRWATHPRYGFEIANKAERPAAFLEFYESLSPERLLAERMNFIDLDQASRMAVKALKPIIQRELPSGLDKLYEKIRKTPSAQVFFASDDRVDEAKSAQLRHWNEISAGEFDGDYYSNVRRIGEAYARSGFDPRWYIGGYSLLAEHLIKSIVSERWPRKLIGGGSKRDADEVGAMISGLVKAILLDIDIGIAVYLESGERARVAGEREAQEKERSLVSSTIGLGLAELAQKNLAHRITDELPEAYSRVQGDFNSAIGHLERAVKAVSDTVDNVCSGMNEILVASDDLARRTEQQAVTLEQTAGALNEITARVSVTADGAKEAHEAMLVARSDAEQSGEVVRRAVDAMTKISTSSKEIGQIISVIDEIAFQTNLLALNAGVEIGRAHV